MCSYEVTMIDPSQDLNYETVDKLPEVLVANRLYFIAPTESKHGEIYLADAKGQSVRILPTKAYLEPEPPLLGHWEQRQGILCCNGMAIQPDSKLLDWIVKCLNKETQLYRNSLPKFHPLRES